MSHDDPTTESDGDPTSEPDEHATGESDQDPTGESPTADDIPNPDRPADDPIAQIEAELDRASDADDTNVQLQLDTLAAGLDRIESWSDAPKPSRVSTIIDKLGGLEAEVDDPEEERHIASARRRLEELLDDPEYQALYEDESDEES